MVKLPRDASEQRSCTSVYWQIAFLHFQVRKKIYMNGKRNATGTVVYDQITTSVQCKIIDDSCLLQANMASNVHSHQHLMGPALMAGCPRWNLGAYAKNGVPLPQIFRFNHWVTPVGLIIKPLSCCMCMCVCVCHAQKSLTAVQCLSSRTLSVFSVRPICSLWRSDC